MIPATHYTAVRFIVDGAICTNESGEGAFCREICEEHADCPADHSCGGISGTSTKSCQPD